MPPSPELSSASQTDRATNQGKLKSDVRRLEATIRVSVGEHCPMTIVEATESIRHVNNTEASCTVEYVTNDLDAHCSEVEARMGTCSSVECDDSRDQAVVRITSDCQEACICSTFGRHGCTPQIEGYVDNHLVITTTFSDRDRFRELVSELREMAPSVQVDTLRETTPDRRHSLSTAIDVSVLTETQREFLKLALEEGYFESPRQISQAELAEDLGISPSMVSRRVRSIEQRLFFQIESSLDIF